LIKNLDWIYESYLPLVKFSQTLFFGSNSMEFDKDFVGKALTSHLQTHGCTIVIGEKKGVINMFLDSLSLFLTTASEKKRSAHVHPDRPYVPDLVLQGIVASKSAVADEEVIQSLLPSTLIDLNMLTVLQTHPFHEYCVLRKEFMKMEMEKILTSKHKENLWTAQDTLFRQVKSIAPCIEKLVIEVYRLPHSLREGYIAQSMRLLIRKAVILIKYVEAEVDVQRSNLGTLEASVVRKIRQDLDLTSDSDFAVLLGIAEKLSPGIYVALAGDPASIQQKFVELFDSF